MVYDCVKLIVVRDGSALVCSEFGERFANVGDVLLLGANVSCEARPEGHVTVSVIYLDSDYVLDQLFWQYAAFLGDRVSALSLANAIYAEPAQLIRLDEDRIGLLMPWLDELVALSIEGKYRERFHRVQALWFSIVDHLVPFIRTSSIHKAPLLRAQIKPALPRGRKFAPLRAEARTVRELLSSEIWQAWPLSKLTRLVHLSEKQLVRVFVDAYGKTPLAYLTMLRVEEMARLLRESNLSVAEVGRRVGWASRNRATAAFRESAGITPGRYRSMRRLGSGAHLSGDDLQPSNTITE